MCPHGSSPTVQGLMLYYGSFHFKFMPLFTFLIKLNRIDEGITAFFYTMENQMKPLSDFDL
jgi:hypothetical protein